MTTKGVTLVGASDRTEGIALDGSGKTAKSFALGRLIAVKAKEKGIARSCSTAAATSTTGA